MFADPDTDMLSVGSRGCNFNCPHCINREHAWSKHDKQSDIVVSPENIVEYAQAMKVAAIAANFNEPLLAVTYWRDIFKLAKERGFYTVAVTNGYSTPEALEVVLPYLDVFRYDIKAASKEAMKKQAAGIDPQGILDNLIYIREKFPKVHIETVTMLLKGINDSHKELSSIASWIRHNLGEITPWNVSPSLPLHTSKLAKAPSYTRPDQLIRPNGAHTSLSIKFTNTGEGDLVQLVLGSWDLGIDESKQNLEDHPELVRALEIGKRAGLKNVIPKLDGH